MVSSSGGLNGSGSGLSGCGRGLSGSGSRRPPAFSHHHFHWPPRELLPVAMLHGSFCARAQAKGDERAPARVALGVAQHPQLDDLAMHLKEGPQADIVDELGAHDICSHTILIR